MNKQKKPLISLTNRDERL